MTTATITHADLDNFTGTTQWYKGTLGLLFTDGIHFLAEQAGAHWLIDVVASYQPQLNRNPRLADFQLWQIRRTKGKNPAGVTVTCRGDSDEPPVVTQYIPYSDFPESLLPLEWYVEGGVMLLKSEH